MDEDPTRVQLLAEARFAAGQTMQAAPLDWQTDPDWVAVIVFVPNEHVEIVEPGTPMGEMEP